MINLETHFINIFVLFSKKMKFQTVAATEIILKDGFITFSYSNVKKLIFL